MNTTLRDVHDAWAIWRHQARPDHPAIVPFDELTPDVQELSNGTTKAKVTQTCDSTEVFIANEHKDHPKRCKVQIGQRVNEVYIRPGESRTLTLNAPAMAMRVGLSCVNDWNRPK